MQRENSGINFKSLSANDLSTEHFLTANEDNGDDASSSFKSTTQLDGTTSKTRPMKLNKFANFSHITSSALVDSDNEESSDDNNVVGERRAKFVVGDSDEQTRSADKSSANQQFERSLTVEANSLSSGNSGNRASNSRLMWQRHSLLHRSYVLQTNGIDEDDDDDADYEGYHHGNKDKFDSKNKLVRASTSDGDVFVVGTKAFDGNNNTSIGIGNQSNTHDHDEASFSSIQTQADTLKQKMAAATNAQQCEHEQQLANNRYQAQVLIRIDDTSRSNCHAAGEDSPITIIGDSELDLLPPPPPSSPVISDTPIEVDFEVRRKSNLSQALRANLSPIDGSSIDQQAGSLSDNSHQRSSDKMALLERRQMEERLRNWKKSNKIITHIRDNPFNLHMECLEKIEQLNLNAESDSCEKQDNQASSSNNNNDQQNNNKQHNDQLQNYATHLSHLYQRNQTLMDNNSDFRNLLYNIICCLLIQEEQVLSSASVTKMIDVIRTHLDSATKYYFNAIMQLSINNNNNNNQTNETTPNRRKSSLGSITSCSTSSNTSSGNQQQQQQQQELQTSDKNTLSPINAGDRRQKSVNFRRISSVSYNDEQLINDLCDHQDSQSDRTAGSSAGANGYSGSSASESPWRYEELSSECKHQTRSVSGQQQQQQQQQQYNSQSSLENQSTSTINDSGLGTTTNHEHRGRGRAAKKLTRQQYSNQEVEVPLEDRRSSWINSRRKLSYFSSDDCFTNLTRTDDDVPEFLRRKSDQQQQSKPIDVACLKSELEWTLNKLINFELRYTWLTGQDTLRRAIRKIGVPNEIRGKVWLILIDQMIGVKYDAVKLLEEATKTIITDDEECNQDSLSLMNSLSLSSQQHFYHNHNNNNNSNSDHHQADNSSEIHAILKQIDLDVNRTMPGHKLFDDGAEGGIKLKRILVAYSIHVNREIAYCQGFNFIVALLLSVFDGDEERALRGFICIVDHIFPSKFYFDHYLTGARADQFLLTDFICDQLIKNPSSGERKMIEGITSSITLNWFISLFHGAVPTLTRLTILDHFMLEGVKALFRFTMAILYLAFQVTPPSSCEVFNTIRITARDMYDIKLLLSIVEQIKLPKDSYFAIRRSFYMLQSSFNSDQFYIQSLSSEANKHCVANKPLSVQQMPDTKPPALSLISGSYLVSAMSDNSHFRQQLSNNGSANANYHCGPNQMGGGPRICTSSDRSKVCMQNIGKLGRSHLKIMDANDRSNERSLMSPLRNCLVIGISNCGRNLIVARQSSRKNFKLFKEQDLTFHIHELSTEIFDGFYLEDMHIALILTNVGEIYKIDTSKCFTDNQTGSAETLMLRSSTSSSQPASSPSLGSTFSGGENERLKLRLASLDPLTKLLWIYVECEDNTPMPSSPATKNNNSNQQKDKKNHDADDQLGNPVEARRRAMRSNNPFMFDSEDLTTPFGSADPQQQTRNYQRKILIIDVMTFDMFSAFTVHQGFGDIIKLRTSLVAFCQLANPMSNQFSSRIVRIGPTGRYEHLLSFSDVVDFMINLSDDHKYQSQHQQQHQQQDSNSHTLTRNSQRYSSIRKLFNRSASLNCNHSESLPTAAASSSPLSTVGAGTLTRYYRSLLRSHSSAAGEPVITSGERNLNTNDNSGLESNQKKTKSEDRSEEEEEKGEKEQKQQIDKPKCKLTYGPSKTFMDHSSCRSILKSCANEVESTYVSDYLPVNMAFIFRNGKIALFEFTKSYAIHTRESQLDRYDYSRVIDVTKSNDDFIITILTVLGKLIKVVI